MIGADADASQMAKRKRSEDWFWVPSGVLVGGLTFGFDVFTQWARLMTCVALLAAVAAWTGRDPRERFAGIPAALLVLAAGGLTMRLLTPGWWVLTTIAVTTATAVALVGWRKRRTPTEAESAPVPAEPPANWPRTAAERRAAMERRMAHGADEQRRRQAERAVEYEREAELRREQGAARRQAEADNSTGG